MEDRENRDVLPIDFKNLTPEMNLKPTCDENKTENGPPLPSLPDTTCWD